MTFIGDHFLRVILLKIAAQVFSPADLKSFFLHDQPEAVFSHPVNGK
jgi:hypothetical protein